MVAVCKLQMISEFFAILFCLFCVFTFVGDSLICLHRCCFVVSLMLPFCGPIPWLAHLSVISVCCLCVCLSICLCLSVSSFPCVFHVGGNGWYAPGINMILFPPDNASVFCTNLSRLPRCWSSWVASATSCKVFWSMVNEMFEWLVHPGKKKLWTLSKFFHPFCLFTSPTIRGSFPCSTYNKRLWCVGENSVSVILAFCDGCFQCYQSLQDVNCLKRSRSWGCCLTSSMMGVNCLFS